MPDPSRGAAASRAQAFGFPWWTWRPTSPCPRIHPARYLDPGEAIDFIKAHRPELDGDHVWSVVFELDKPPQKDGDPLAVQLIGITNPEISESDVKAILSEWREFAKLADERDWDDDELDYANRHDDD